MAPVTREQVERARADGYRAGQTLQPPRPNPYAPQHVPEWEGPRTAAERVRLERDQRPARILARVWRVGYQAGQRARTQPSDGDG